MTTSNSSEGDNVLNRLSSIGAQPILGLAGHTIADFWGWAYSDLLSNTVRPLLAEFIVAAALGVQKQPRLEWDAVDLRYRGKRIEVKSAGRVQSWAQSRPSVVRFDIALKQPWDAMTGEQAFVPMRSADCYVFCLHAETDRTRADARDLGQWEFYVVATARLAAAVGRQKGIGLGPLRRLTDPIPYVGLREAVDEALGFSSSGQSLVPAPLPLEGQPIA